MYKAVIERSELLQICSGLEGLLDDSQFKYLTMSKSPFFGLETLFSIKQEGVNEQSVQVQKERCIGEVAVESIGGPQYIIRTNFPNWLKEQVEQGYRILTYSRETDSGMPDYRDTYIFVGRRIVIEGNDSFIVDELTKGVSFTGILYGRKNGVEIDQTPFWLKLLKNPAMIPKLMLGLYLESKEEEID